MVKMTAGGLVAGPLLGHSKGVRSVSFSSDGRQLASGADDKTVRIWDAQIWETIIELSGHTHQVFSVCFSPDSALVASGSRDNSIIIWDAKSGCIVGGLFEGHTAPVGAITFSVDGKYVISGFLDLKLRIWDVRSGSTVRILEGHADNVWCLALSPDGSRDNTIRVWDISDLLTST